MSKLQCYTFLSHFLIFLLLNIFHEYLLTKNLIYFMDNIIWEEFKKIVILRIKD